VSNRELGEEGAFTMALYEEMLDYVQEYREANSEVTAGAQ